MLELNALCSRCGIGNASTWIAKHRLVKDFFRDQGRQSDTAEAELNQLVQYRNDAAHGGAAVDTVLGPDVLVEYIEFVEALCGALVECVQASVLAEATVIGGASRAGSITERFRENRVVAIVGKQTFKVGDSVYLAGENYCYLAKIISIMEDDVLKDSITVLNDKEVGFSFDVPPVKRAEIYYLAI
jgi:hypothetical protein